MGTVAIDYIWQAIRESERSDEFQFMDDELKMKAEATRLTQFLRIQSGMPGRESTTKTTLSPASGL